MSPGAVARAQGPPPPPPGPPPDAEGSTQDFEKLSLDDLLNPTIVTATKSARTLEQTPSIVTVFDREEIERLGARQLIDLLRHVPGFYEVGSQLERNIAIRGVHASSPYHFVVLLDGLPMNDFLFSSSSPDSFSLEMAERVEIIRGPGSSIYGPNALMGVVNIITHRPGDETTVRQTVTAGLARELRADLNFTTPMGSDGSGMVGSVSFWRQDGTRLPISPTEDVLAPTLGQNISDGIQPGENLTGPLAGASAAVNGYAPSFSAFLKYQHADRAAVRLLVSRTELEIQRTHRQGLFVDGTGDLQRPSYINERLVLDLETRWGDVDTWGQITLRPSLLGFGHELRSQTVMPPYYEAATREGTAVVYGWSGRDLRVSPAVEYAVELPDLGRIFRNTSLVAGLQAEYDVASSYRTTECFRDIEGRFNPSIYGRDPSRGVPDLVCLESLMLREGLIVDDFGTIRESEDRPLFGDGDELRVGSFVQLSTSLPGEVGVVLGGRVDYNVTYSPQFSPRVAVVAPLGRGFYAKTQLASAFVYPAFLYRTGNSLSDYQGNPAIQPQSIRTLEALVGFKGRKVRTELGAYYNDVRRFITFDLPRNARTGQFLFSNAGDLRVVGVEGTAVFHLLRERLILDLQGTFARSLPGTTAIFLADGELGGPSKYPQLLGRALVSGTPLRRLRLTVDAGMSTPVRQTIAPEVQFQGIAGTDGASYSSRAAGEFDTAELTVNAGAAYTIDDRWKVSVNATNLFDWRRYRPGSVLVPYLAEGRRLTLSVSFLY